MTLPLLFVIAVAWIGFLFVLSSPPAWRCRASCPSLLDEGVQHLSCPFDSGSVENPEFIVAVEADQRLRSWNLLLLSPVV